MMIPGFDALRSGAGSTFAGMAADDAASNTELADTFFRGLARAKGAQYTANAIRAAGEADRQAAESRGWSSLGSSIIGAVGSVAGAGLQAARAPQPAPNTWSQSAGLTFDPGQYRSPSIDFRSGGTWTR